MPIKNICLISRSIYPHPISSHTQNMQTFDGWSRFWDNVVIVAQCRSNTKKISSHNKIYGVLLPLIANRYLNVIYFTIFGIFEINRLLKKYNFEIFQASDAGGALLALMASKVYKRKYIFEIQGDIFDYPTKNKNKIHSYFVKFFSRFLAKRADYIRIVSPFLYDPLDRLGVDRKKIFLIPPRCDSKLFNNKNIDPTIYQKLPINKYNILFIGNLIYVKGVDILLEAFALIEKEFSDIALFYVGDGEEELQLKSRVSELRLDKKVIFFGRLDYKLIPSIMYYSDVLILPSREEGVGRVILESMAMKLPVIASNIGGIPLVIEDAKDGILFEPEDINELKRHILFLINNKSFSDNITNNAHQKFIDNYEYEVSMKMFLNMYKSILN